LKTELLYGPNLLQIYQIVRDKVEMRNWSSRI